MSEIRSIEGFNSLLDSYSDAAWVCGNEGATADDDARKARIGAKVRDTYAALRAENKRLQEALDHEQRAMGFLIAAMQTTGDPRSLPEIVEWAHAATALAAPQEEK